MLVFLVMGCVRPDTAPRVGVTGATAPLREVLARQGLIVVDLVPDERTADRVLDALDGLVLGPGADLDPGLYGQPAHPTVVPLPIARQTQDLALAVAAVGRDLPVLGICLGAQELAVGLGGSLIQDVPSQVPNSVDHRAAHAIAVEPGSPVAQWLGPGTGVISNHHQAVDVLPEGLVVAARAPDGVLEAFYAPERSFVVGVQYHPESDPSDTQLRMWQALAESVRSHARK